MAKRAKKVVAKVQEPAQEISMQEQLVVEMYDELLLQRRDGNESVRGLLEDVHNRDIIKVAYQKFYGENVTPIFLGRRKQEAA